jgi:hypothetical protein
MRAGNSTYSNNLYDAIVTQPHLREGVEEFESSLMTMCTNRTYGSVDVTWYLNTFVVIHSLSA